MRQLTALFLALLLIFSLTGCGSRTSGEADGALSEKRDTAQTAAKEEQPAGENTPAGEELAAVLGNEHLKNISENLPVLVEIYIDHGGPAETASLTDSADIAEFTELLSQVTVGAETDEYVTDNYNWFALTFADGETVSVSLNLKNLEVSSGGALHVYELLGFDGLWEYMNAVAEFPEDSESGTGGS